MFLCCFLRYRFLKFCFPLNNYQLPLCFTCLVRPIMLIANLYSSLLFFVMYTRLSPFLWYIVHWSYCFNVSSMDFCLFVFVCFVFVCFCFDCMFRYCFFNIVQDRFWYLVPDHSFWNVKCPVINNYSAYCFRYMVI